MRISIVSRMVSDSPDYYRLSGRLNYFVSLLLEQVQGNNGLIVVAVGFAVTFCYFIGANDAANAWSSSVGSGTDPPACLLHSMQLRALLLAPRAHMTTQSRASILI